MMGGRAAEDIFFGEITTGAANDFDQATTIAKAMVIEYGMSDLGPINFGPNMDITQMGKAYYQENVVSQEVLGKIDAEVKRIITECYDKAVSIIRKNKVALEKVAKELVKKESLDQDEFESIVGLKQKLK